jgi:hypothetical protein
MSNNQVFVLVFGVWFELQLLDRKLYSYYDMGKIGNYLDLIQNEFCFCPQKGCTSRAYK